MVSSVGASGRRAGVGAGVGVNRQAVDRPERQQRRKRVPAFMNECDEQAQRIDHELPERHVRNHYGQRRRHEQEPDRLFVLFV